MEGLAWRTVILQSRKIACSSPIISTLAANCRGTQSINRQAMVSSLSNPALGTLGEALPVADTATTTMTPLLLVVLTLAGFLSVTLFRKPTAQHNDKIPWPPGTLPVFFNTFQILKHKDNLLDMIALVCEHMEGRPWQGKMVGRPATIYFARPELIEDVLTTQSANFGKGAYFTENTYDFLGDGIFAVDGPKWAQQRKTASNLFSQRALRDSMAVTVNEQAQALVEILQGKADTHEPVDMFKLFNRFTFEVFTEIGFGVKIGNLNDEAMTPIQGAFDAAQPLLIRRFMVPSWLWKSQRYFNVGSEKQIKSVIELIDDTVYGIISQSISNRQNSDASDVDAGRKDIISLFLDEVSYDVKTDSTSKIHNGKETAFELKFLRDVVVNFLIAGRDTTAQALSWFVFCVSQSPHAERKIRDELAAELPELDAGGGEQASTPSMEQLHQLVYLEAAIKETLRLYPSVSDNTKQCLKDTLLCDGTFIKAGTYIAYPGYSLGRMTHVWGPDAKEFKPERWIDRDTGKLITVSAYKFNSFHAGPRMCLGMNLAMMEIKMVAAVLLSKFRFSLVPGQNITYGLSTTLPIKGALMMNIVPNKPSSS